MSNVGCRRLNGLNRPHVPLQQVDRMDTLIHERPTPVIFPGSPPTPRRIVCFTSVPLYVGGTQYQIAESVLVYGCYQLPACFVKTRRKDNTYFYAGFTGRIDDGIAP